MGTVRTTYPLDSLPYGRRVGVTAPTSSIETDQFGNSKRRGATLADSTSYLGRLDEVAPEDHIDASSVMQIAIYNLLRTMTMHRRSLEAVVAGSPGPFSSFSWRKIGFDMPSVGEQEDPMPVAAIMKNSECAFDYQSLQTALIEDTVDVYGEGTVLRKIGIATQQFAVHCLSAHKEERRAIRSAFERTFLAEPNDDQAGRTIIVAQHYDQTVRVQMRSLDDAESPPREHANKHETIAIFDADVDVVVLVPRPVDFVRTVNNITVGTRVGA